jgi:serine/threonine protein kinase
MLLNLATCSECGQAVPGDARTLGLCPRCLMRSALVGDRGDRRPAVSAPPNASLLCETLAGLEVLDLIGRGGMGFVYRARQRSLDRLVAVKLFPRDAFADDPSFAQRFANEGRILASLSHPNIVAAYEFGETDRFCHLVMELIPGRSVRQRIEEGPVPQAAALDIARQVCLALEYAHSRGVIHRDIKPENILLEPAADGTTRVRVADFGLAKLIQRRPTDFSAITAPNRLMGTPDYMAPEQRSRPADVDARADVYALGVVLYEMLAGQLPLGRFAPPSTDARVNTLVLRCLETRPEDRFASIADVRRAIESVRARRLEDRWVWLAAAAIVVIALSIAIYTLRPKPHPTSDNLASATASTSTRPIVTTTRPAAAPIPAVPYTPASGPDRIAIAVPGNAWNFGNPPFPRPIGPGGPGALLERMIVDFGPDRIATVIVDDMPGDVRAFIVDRLRDLSSASSTASSGGGRSVTVILAPVRDLDTLAKKIDFGKVVKIDPSKRTIEVVCDNPRRLPEPLPPAVKDPADPAFYTRNLADLSCWDRHRREEALERLAKAQPKQLQTEIAATIAHLTTDRETSTRKAALEALAAWSGPDAVPTLSTVLRDDEDHWVREAAIKALGQIKDPRAAEALIATMPKHRRDVTEALKQIGPPAEDTVIALLKHEDGWVRRDAAEILADIGTIKSLRPLASAQSDKDGLVRMAASRATNAIKERTTNP